MNRENRPWPPLIVAERVPRSVKWRDALLTLAMWAFFAALLDIEFQLLFGPHLERLGFGPFDTNANWLLFFERLMPFVLTAAALGAMLVIISLRTLHRRRRALLLPQPAPLAAAEEARRAGLDEATLIAARERPIVIVHIDPDGRHRIETRQG